MTDKKELAENMPFWKDLSSSEQSFFINSCAIKSYQKGQIIHGSGQDCLGMVLVASGQIRAYLLSEEGREITLFRIYEGEHCVMSASCVISAITFDTQMVAETDCTLLILSPSAFSSLSEQNIYVRCFMYELTTKRFSSVMWTMQQILFYGFDKRLAGFLLKEHERTQAFEIRMTQEEIAKELGSAREVVSRMLKRFSCDGLIELKRKTIILKNTDALKSILY